MHQLYLLTPIYMSFNVQWSKYHKIYKHLTQKSAVDARICSLIGILEDHIVAFGMGGQTHGQQTGFKREIIRIPASPTKEAHDNATESSSGRLISEIGSFKAFAENNKDLI